jgi:hypothetical protein
MARATEYRLALEGWRPVVKVRVLDTDGVFRGGLLETETVSRLTSRIWDAPPRLDFFEQLVDYRGDGDEWFRLLLSKHPRLMGPTGDSFDEDSTAYRYSAEEASAWLQRFGFPLPADLVGQPASQTSDAPSSLEPAHERAYGLYTWALEQNPDLKTDKDAYDWLSQRPEIPGKLPGKVDTWCRYLTSARNHKDELKHRSRASRRPDAGRSVADRDEV